MLFKFRMLLLHLFAFLNNAPNNSLHETQLSAIDGHYGNCSLENYSHSEHFSLYVRHFNAMDF